MARGKKAPKQLDDFSKKVVTESPAVFQTMIDTSRDWQRQFAQVWEDGQELYVAGTTFGWGNDVSPYDAGAPSDRIIVNKAKQLIDSIASATLMRNPKFKLYPTVMGDLEAAQTAEKYLNQVYSRYGMNKAFQEACFDALVKSCGWLKIGWNLEYETVPTDQEAVLAEVDRLAGEVQQFELQNPELANSLPSPEDIVPSVLEGAIDNQRQVARISHPMLFRVSPFDMFVDPMAKNMSNVRWIAERVIRNTNDVRNDKRYTSARKDVEPSPLEASRRGTFRGLTNRTGLATGQTIYHDIPRQTVIWEMYSIEYDVFAVWAEGTDEWLVKPRGFPISPHPYIFIPMFPVPDRFYPAGILPHITRLQEALSEVATDTLTHKRRSKNMIMMREEYITDEAQAAINTGAENGIVPISTGGGQEMPLTSIATEFPNPRINQDWYVFEQQMEKYIEELTGLQDFLKAAPSTRRSALEASIANDRHSARARQLNQTMEEAARTLGRKTIALAQNYLFAEEPIGIIENGRVQTHGIDTATRDNIASEREFRFEVEVGSIASKDDAVAKHESNQLFQQLIPIASAPGSPINLRALVERYLQDQGVSEPEDLLAQPTMPSPTGADADIPPEALANTPAQPAVNAQVPETAAFQ